MGTYRGAGDDPALELLLGSSGEIFELEDGYRVKIEARQVTPRPEIPHGIRYSLTLHDPQGERVIGFDNAHRPRLLRRTRFEPKRATRDHMHKPGIVMEYTYRSAAQLLEDFWSAVFLYMEK
jgi:hypothetical protein